MESINIIRKEETGSTNADLRELLANNAPEGTVVVAETQTQGRGRHDRSWHSPAGLNLYFSVLLRPVGNGARIPQLAMLAAVALHKTLLGLEPSLDLGLKWPNDLWLDGLKTSGILCESVASPHPGVIIGIGLNVNSKLQHFPEELQTIATSLSLAAGHNFDRIQILLTFLENLVDEYKAWHKSSEQLFEYWNQHDCLKGREIIVSDRDEAICGIADGINDWGFLRLKLADGTIKAISAGDVHITSIS